MIKQEEGANYWHLNDSRWEIELFYTLDGFLNVMQRRHVQAFYHANEITHVHQIQMFIDF